MSDKTRRERGLEKALHDLTTAVCHAASLVDDAMKGPSNEQRGRNVANVMNWLDHQNDAAMHFALGMSFKKIENRKKRCGKDAKQ